MLKKFGYSLVVAGALMLGVGVVNTVFVSTVRAEEKHATNANICRQSLNMIASANVTLQKVI